MANTFRKIYKKTGNSGSSSDYELIANVGVNGIDLDIMKGATSSSSGEIGLVPKPTAGQQNYILSASGIWKNINDILNIMKGATSSSSGEIGLVPKPTAGQQNYILSASGIWKNINDILNIDNLKIEIMKKIYPVKTIYVSTNNTNPATLFGFGTWTSWGSGRVLVGVNTSDNDFKTVEKTGGAKSNSYTFNHNHQVGASITNTDIAPGKGIIAHGSDYTSLSSIGSTSLNTKSISTVQPYITCYFWKRTA